LDGQRIWSTYIGNQGEDTFYYDDLLSDSVVVFGENLYVALLAGRDNGISTENSFQQSKDYFWCGALVKFNTEGVKQWGTYYGLNPLLDNGGPAFVNVSIDETGNPYLCGTTNFQNNISTSGTFQDTITDTYFNYDAFVAKFSPFGERLWGTYFGGDMYETASKVHILENRFYLIGLTESTSGITTSSSFQPNFINTNNSQVNPKNNIFLARFDPTNLSNEDFTNGLIKIYPNPVENYFMILALEENLQIEIFDVLGKKIHSKKTNSLETRIETNDFSEGVYLVKIQDNKNQLITKKIVVN
jgi:hypothetical protein